jgi:hypothetical protein
MAVAFGGAGVLVAAYEFAYVVERWNVGWTADDGVRAARQSSLP